MSQLKSGETTFSVNFFEVFSKSWSTNWHRDLKIQTINFVSENSDFD